jgi:hypothetical protein
MTLSARYWWFMPVILTTLGAEIRRICVGDQPRKIIRETPSPKQPDQKELEVRFK